MDFKEQDRVRALVAQAGTVTGDDPELVMDLQESRTSYHVPAGAMGTVTRIRYYPAPFPCVVLFDDGQEVGMPAQDLERVAL